VLPTCATRARFRLLITLLLPTLGRPTTPAGFSWLTCVQTDVHDDNQQIRMAASSTVQYHHGLQKTRNAMVQVGVPTVMAVLRPALRA
jgi:hypothetical protein